MTCNNNVNIVEINLRPKTFYVPPNAMNNNTATSQGYKLCESLADETLGQELQLNK